MAVRLFVILARNRRRAVVFRRGPTRQVLLLCWRTDTDAIEPGQWLKGRIYERRCDLSPSGERLVYFAASWKPPLRTWTAVSKPPWLTAIALWPKGDAWGGGGLFDDDTHVQLNHYPSDTAPPVAPLPKPLRVMRFGERWGRGEDMPIWGVRLLRDGWSLEQSGIARETKRGEREAWFVYDPPEVWTRRSPRDPGLRLQMRLLGMSQKDGPWYVIEHTVVGDDGVVVALGETDWADWDVNGDLIFARDGRLYRARRQRSHTLGAAREIADLRPMKFEARESPSDAKRW